MSTTAPSDSNSLPIFLAVCALSFPVIVFLVFGDGKHTREWEADTPLRSPPTATSDRNQAADVLEHTHGDSLDRLGEVENRLVDKVLRNDTDYSEIDRDLAPLEDEARRRLQAFNRKPKELGYSRDVRREAAYRTLMDNGYSSSEARLTVQAMEAEHMLPDPPRR